MRKILLTTTLFIVNCSLSGCVLFAAGAGAEAGYVASQEGRTTGETIDDQTIVASVKTKMLADPDVSGLAINVDSYKANVTLKGYVKTQREMDRAMELAQGTRGVKSVVSKMVLDQP